MLEFFLRRKVGLLEFYSTGRFEHPDSQVSLNMSSERSYIALISLIVVTQAGIDDEVFASGIRWSL